MHRRQVGRQTTELSPWPTSRTLVLLFWIGSLFSFQVWSQEREVELETSWAQILQTRSNNQGVENLRKDRLTDAHESFLKALEPDPFRSEIHFNLGVVYDKSDEVERALAEYRMADELSQSDEIKFAARFNQGFLLGRMQRVDEALQAYQMALAIRPHSQEVKTNIELLLKGGSGQGGGDGRSQSEPQGPVENPPPNQYQGNDLKPDDVRKIFEELDRQEKRVRAKEEESKNQGQESSNGKDW